MAAHSFLPLEKVPSAAFGLVLGIAGHAVGWPFPRGGAQRIADALVSYFRSLGGEIETGARVGSVDELPPARAVLCDVTPRQLARIAAAVCPQATNASWSVTLTAPPLTKLTGRSTTPCLGGRKSARAGTVHLGGTLEEVAASERAAWRGGHAEKPFVLVAQPSLFDPTRAPAGKHTLWAYCHVSFGSDVDMTERIERQVERFAPGFRDRVLARHVMSPADLERHNANLIGGDINGGAQTLRQLLTRPTLRLYSTPRKGLYICSSSTPPGGGVHGMCGHAAARRALRDVL